MSGHSKWAKIKRTKGVNDQKRGAIFTKLGNTITIAAKSGGGDIDLNFALRIAVDKAKAANMPKDNIQKAIDRGVGTGKDAIVFENVSYEGYLGGDVAFIVDCLTDNKNRTFAEVKKLIEQSGGQMAASGSVSWQFEEKGKISMYLAKVEKSTKFGSADKLVRLTNKDEIMLEILDIEGVIDVLESNSEFEDRDDLIGDGNASYESFDVYTQKSSMNIVYKKLEELGYKIEDAQIVKISKNLVSIDESKQEKLEKFYENVEQSEDVQDIWVNVA